MRNTSSLLKDDIFSRSKKTKSKKIRKMGINQVSGRRLRKLSEKNHEKKKKRDLKMEIRVFYERKRKSFLEGDISRVSFPISKKKKTREREKSRGKEES